jgi:hypothetical protein
MNKLKEWGIASGAWVQNNPVLSVCVVSLIAVFILGFALGR